MSLLIKKMLFNLVLLFYMTQAWCECQSDPSEQSALARQPFVSQLGHYTPELFLTFLLILKIRWNGSNKGYSEQGGASPENSLPLAWVIPCVFPVSTLKHIFLTCEDPIKKKKKKLQERGLYISPLLVTSFCVFEAKI